MDKRKGILNIGTSVVSRIILLLAALYVRRLLIIYIGNEVNGLNSLYASIIGLLSVAELGVGSAIIYSMYRPIVDGEKRKVAALYCLYRRLYRMIGAVIFIAGLAVMPFLPRLIGDYDSLDVNVYSTFLLTLISVVLSYLYSAKTSLIEAHKDNYINVGIATVSRLLRYALQIAALLITRSYIAYLICQIIETLVIWAMTEHAVRKLHPDIIRMRERMDSSATAEVTRNIKAMFMHKIGSILVGSVDSMIISAFIGVTVLGMYGNYAAIAGAMTGILALFFTPLTSVIGHLCATNKPAEIKKYFNHFYCINYMLGVIFFLGYYAVIDDLIVILFGSDLEMQRAVPFIIALNTFISYMRYTPLLFRDATGTFYYDRWKPVAEGITNLLLSIFLVKMLPAEYGVVGVIVATIITTLLICDIIEPHIIFRYVFKEPAKEFYIRNYCGIGIFAVCLIIVDKIRLSIPGNMAEILVNGMISLAISASLMIVLSLLNKTFRQEARIVIAQCAEWIRKIHEKGNRGDGQ